MMPRSIELPLSREIAESLTAGESVLISGYIYTARDAAHKRLVELCEKGEPLPFEIKDSVIYFVGPTPKREGEVIGSAGPTTSYRMDAYSPTLISLGLRGMIGKGKRSREVIEAMKEHGAVYFGAIGGCGALFSSRIKEAELVCYSDLGAEAVYRLKVSDFPLTVVIDTKGNNYYEIGRDAYLSSIKED